MGRWLGIALTVAILVLAATQLSCLAGDRAGSWPGEASGVSEPAAAPELPVRFEADHEMPGAGPVLTR